MSTFWVIPLGVGAAGAVGLAVVSRKLARELEVLQRALQPLRADRDAAARQGRHTRPTR